MKLGLNIGISHPALFNSIVAAPVIPFPNTALSSMVGWWDANEANNTIVNDSVSFAPSAVNTSTNRITMTLSGFVRNADTNATPGRFITTGTLPAPLQENVDYLPEDMGDGTFRFFPIMDDSNYTLFNGYEEGESIRPYYGYSLQVGEIDFTTQGTGTHTFVTGDLYYRLFNKLNNTANFIADDNKANNMLKRKSDGTFNYIESVGSVGHKADNGSSGKRYVDEIDNATFGALINNRRYYWQILVLKPYIQYHIAKYRAFLYPSNLNAGTGVFTVQGHGFATGTALSWGVISNPGGAFPTVNGAALPSTLYLRSLTANTFTLHRTSTDATNNTNAITFLDTGSKVFYICDDKTARMEPMNRTFALDVNTSDGNNHHATTSIYVYQKDVVVDTTTFRLTAGFNGMIVGACSQLTFGSITTAFPVYLFVPSGAIMPLRADTGTRLAKGWYWATQEGNNLRLHQSEALAIASIGIGVSSLSNTQVIKSSDTTGITGKILLASPSFAWWRGFQDTISLQGVGNARIDVSNKTILTHIHDFSGGGLVYYTSGQNAVGTGLVNANSNMTTANNTGNSLSKMNLFNTNEPHVPFKGDVYEIIFGVSNTDPTSTMNDIITWAKAKYGIN